MVHLANIKYNNNMSWAEIGIINNNLTSAEGILPVVKGGTGATTASTALSNLGGFPSTGGTITGDVEVTGDININDNSLKYNGNNIPFIVESGISGIWTYRKWSDGIAECWGNYNYQFNAGTAHTSWGGVYYISEGLPAIDYPFTFTQIPVVNAFVYNNGTTGAYWVAARANGTTNATPPLYMLRGNSNASAGKFVVSYQVRGTWK